MKIIAIITFIFCVFQGLTQEEEQPLSKSEEIANNQIKIKTQAQMTYTNVKIYTFVCGRFDDFVLKPSTTQDIKGQIHVYWKHQNVYGASEYKQDEEIRLIIYQDNQKVLLDRSFYMLTGFSFLGKKGSTYIIRFLAAGSFTKLISMLTSLPLQIGDDIATKVHIDEAQSRIEKVGNQMKALLTISQRNSLMKEKIGQKILANTKIYMGYEVFEVLLIIGMAITQVIVLTRLLKGGSIV